MSKSRCASHAERICSRLAACRGTASNVMLCTPRRYTKNLEEPDGESTKRCVGTAVSRRTSRDISLFKDSKLDLGDFAVLLAAVFFLDGLEASP